MAIAIAVVSCCAGIGRRIVCNHIDHLFVAGTRQIRYGSVECFLFDFANFLKRQVWLCAVRRCCFLVASNKLAGEPPENVIGNTGRVADIGIFCEPARLESLIREFFHQTFERHSVLQRD